MNIILCGLPKCGKTTVGKKLAETLKWEFIDTDRLIELGYLKNTNKNYSCREIHKMEGEKSFRLIEQQQISSLNAVTNSVIALGGGSLIDPKNRAVVKDIGITIYLKASQDIIWKRINDNGLPSFLDSNNPQEAFDKLVSERIPLYKSSAQWIIDTGELSVEKIIGAILDMKQ